MNSFNSLSSRAAGRPGLAGLRDALGPGFAMIAPTEATLQTATGHGRPRHGRNARS